MTLDLFTLGEMPTEDMVTSLVAPGFGCQFVASDHAIVSDESDQSWEQRKFYCSSNEKHPCGQFWLDITVTLKEEFTWLISAGYITARNYSSQTEEAESPVYNGIRRTYVRRAKFHVEAVGALEVVCDGNSLGITQHEIERYDGQLRSWLARGSYFMGLNVEDALSLWDTQASEHEKVEWHREKRLSNIVYGVWASLTDVQEDGDFSYIEQWDRELGERVVLVKVEIEKILGAEVSLEELANRFDVPIETMKDYMERAK